MASSRSAPLAETLSQLADQVADHNRQLTDLSHALQVAQTDGQAEQRAVAASVANKQTELADQLHRLDGSLNQLD